MKIFKLMVVALVAMLGFTACDKDCDHDFIEVDHSKDLVGTWTCLTENYAEALVIKADGSAVSTGYDGTEYWENVAGNIVVKNGTVTMTFKDNDNFKGHFDIIPGVAFSIFTEEGEHMTYYYCANDLADEIVGMWVCNDGPTDTANDMAIQTFDENGKATFTGYGAFVGNFSLNSTGTYKVIGDLLIQKTSEDNPIEDLPAYIVTKITYSLNGTSLGDVMTQKQISVNGNNVVENTSSWLRIKQTLDLSGKKYDYIKTFISNVKGEDKDIPFFNTNVNFAKFDSSIFDMFLKSTLFGVYFPDSNTIEYSFLLGQEFTPTKAPIKVDGNKMTIKMSTLSAAYRDIDVYTFQDQDNTQMHMFMSTVAFENFLGNMQINLMVAKGQLELSDATAVKAIFDTIENAIQTINVSFVMKKAAK